MQDGKALRRVMDDCDLTGKHLSEISGVPKQQISKFLNGKEISRRNFSKIVRTLDLQARRRYLDAVFDLKLCLGEQPISPFAAFVQQWQEREGISDLELAVLVWERTDLSLRSLWKIIVEGQQPTEGELSEFGIILRDNLNQPYTLDELVAASEGKPILSGHLKGFLTQLVAKDNDDEECDTPIIAVFIDCILQDRGLTRETFSEQESIDLQRLAAILDEGAKPTETEGMVIANALNQSSISKFNRDRGELWDWPTLEQLYEEQNERCGYDKQSSSKMSLEGGEEELRD